MSSDLLKLDFYCFFLSLYLCLSLALALALQQFPNNKLACSSNKTSGIESDDCHHRTDSLHKRQVNITRSSIINRHYYLSSFHPLFPSIVLATRINVFQSFLTHFTERERESERQILLSCSLQWHQKKNQLSKIKESESKKEKKIYYGNDSLV